MYMTCTIQLIWPHPILVPICLAFSTYSETFLCILTASSTDSRALIAQYRIADLQLFLTIRQ